MNIGREVIKTEYMNEECTIEREQYSNGAPAIQLFSMLGEPMARVTVNLPELADQLGPDETFVKTWSENEGLYEALQKLGYLSAPIETIPVSDYCTAYRVKILKGV